MLSERISLILAHLFTVTLLVSSHPPPPDCYESYGLRIKNEILHSCTLRKTDKLVENLSEWNPPREEFKLNLTDTEQGVLSVKFPFPECLRSFEAILLMNESATNEEECMKSPFRSDISIHSKKVLDYDHCKWADNGTCSPCSTVYMETELYNVYTGCYKLKIVPRDPEGESPKFAVVNRYSHNVFIKSNYEKKFIQTPNMTFDYSPIKHMLSILLPLNQTWSENAQIIIYSPKTTECVEEVNLTKIMVVDLNPNVTVQQCETTNPNHKRPSCQPEATGLECTIYNITPGDYCIRAEVLNDDRCDPSTVWTERSHSCIWIYTLVAQEDIPLDPTDAIPTSGGSSFYIYVVLGTIASLVTIAAIVRGIRPPPSPPNPGYPGQDPKILLKEKVLLLYAHDCPHFMDLMSMFRNILQKNSTCEVYDMFDPLLWDMIARGRQECVRRLLSQDDTMIVIVETASAVVHQNALENSFSINYFEPHPNSPLFTYALREIENNVRRHMYKKIFVVRLNGFSEQGKILRHISPFRRYLLPEHLSQLLSSLKDTSCLDIEDCCPEEVRDAAINLQRQLDKLISYKEREPDYLNTVLYRTTKIV